MPLNVNWNGSVYTIPLPGDNYGWGAGTTAYLNALSVAFAPNTSTFILGQEVDMGTAFGLRLPYIRSSSANPAAAGSHRLSHFDTINWRNAANSGDLALAVNGSNQLTFNGGILGAGTVTSVTLALGGAPGPLTLVGSPITTSGTYTIIPNQFDSVTAGYVPASGGGTSNFLRADGTWVAPPASGSVTSVGATSANAAITITGSPITTSGSFTFTANTFTGGTPGVVPASGGGSTNFLRADGVWAPAAAGSVAWGSITGTLSAQTDLQANLDLKAPKLDPVFENQVKLDPTSGTGSVLAQASGNTTTGTIITVVHPDAVTAPMSAVSASVSTNTTVAAPVFNLRRSRDTAAVPAAVLTGDLLGALAFSGYDGSNYNAGANISALTTENWTTSARGTYLSFNVRPTGGTSSLGVMRVQHSATNPFIYFPLANTQIRQTGSLAFTDSTGTNTWATLNTATTSLSQTDLVRKSEVPVYALLPSPVATTTSYTSTGINFNGLANKKYLVTFDGEFDGATVNAAPLLALAGANISAVFGQSNFQSNSTSPAGICSSTEQVTPGSVATSSATIRAATTSLPLNARWFVTMDGTGGNVSLDAAVRSGTGNILTGVLSYVAVT